MFRVRSRSEAAVGGGVGMGHAVHTPFPLASFPFASCSVTVVTSSCLWVPHLFLHSINYGQSIAGPSLILHRQSGKGHYFKVKSLCDFRVMILNSRYLSAFKVEVPCIVNKMQFPGLMKDTHARPRAKQESNASFCSRTECRVQCRALAN